MKQKICFKKSSSVLELLEDFIWYCYGHWLRISKIINNSIEEDDNNNAAACQETVSMPDLSPRHNC